MGFQNSAPVLARVGALVFVDTLAAPHSPSYRSFPAVEGTSPRHAPPGAILAGDGFSSRCASAAGVRHYASAAVRA